MKVGSENENHVLNILYANNHFEHVITCNPIIKFSNIHTCDAYDKKFKS
jgi:pectate lyase